MIKGAKMKKLCCLLVVCLGLAACDENKIVGKCEIYHVNLREDESTLRFLCHCYKEVLALSEKEFLFDITKGRDADWPEIEYKFINETKIVSDKHADELSARSTCDYKCTEFCNIK